jgi:hypothetical protein
LSAAATTPLTSSRPTASVIVFRCIVSSLKKTNHRDADATQLVVPTDAKRRDLVSTIGLKSS